MSLEESDFIAELKKEKTVNPYDDRFFFHEKALDTLKNHFNVLSLDGFDVKNELMQTAFEKLNEQLKQLKQADKALQTLIIKDVIDQMALLYAAVCLAAEAQSSESKQDSLKFFQQLHFMPAVEYDTEYLELIQQIVQIYNNYAFDTEVLVASVRHPMHLLESAIIGADVATVPLKVIKQMAKHPLTDSGLAAFLADWEKVPKE